MKQSLSELIAQLEKINTEQQAYIKRFPFPKEVNENECTTSEN